MTVQREPSRLAWKLAKRARLDHPLPDDVQAELTVRAALTFRGLLFQGWGRTTLDAQQDLARILDEWGWQR